VSKHRLTKNQVIASMAFAILLGVFSHETRLLASEREVHTFLSGEGKVLSTFNYSMYRADVKDTTNAPEKELMVAQTKPSDQAGEPLDEDYDEFDEDIGGIPDPLEPMNRAFFYFNDKLYFWLLKPVATVYKAVLPEAARIGVKNFFDNLLMPVRAVNCLLQGKPKGFGEEIGSFVINSTAGMAGFFNPAGETLNIRRYNEDLGQTLGVYGLGPGIYLHWPIFGPTNLRDMVGRAGDSFLSPVSYSMFNVDEYSLVVYGFETLNNTSLILGEFESLKEAALDPYIAARDAFHQYRQRQIKE
jgi:phospholipid-binding lipoprotein MlaA